MPAECTLNGYNPSLSFVFNCKRTGLGGYVISPHGEKARRDEVHGLFQNGALMPVAQSPVNSNGTISVEPLPPTRAALAEAIESLDRARERLDETHKVVAGLEKIRPAASARQTSALHAEIGRLCEITNCLDAEAAGVRPSLPAELQQAERWLGEIYTAAAIAEERLSIAQQDYIAAANGAREAMRRRDDAVWAATVEAAGPALRKLGRAVSAVYERDARVRSLISELREIGHRNSETNSGAFAAAYAVETALNAIRRQTAQGVDIALVRSLIERLKSDPHASL
jgi:hypothetical protein